MAPRTRSPAVRAYATRITSYNVCYTKLLRFAGVFAVFSFFVTQISPAIEAIIRVRGLDYPVVDVGWPPLAAITWSSSLTPLVIPLIMSYNFV